MTDPRPLVAHVMYRFDTGGLENGVVNLINHMPAEHYRHAVIALTEVTDFRERIKRDDVQFISLNKAPGHGFKLTPSFSSFFANYARRLFTAVIWQHLKFSFPPGWLVCRYVFMVNTAGISAISMALTSRCNASDAFTAHL